MTEKATEKEFKEGCMQEGDTWKLVIDAECGDWAGAKPCRHCKNEHVKIKKRFDGSTWQERVWICPRLVVAENEGGCNSTGVCADCISDVIRNEPGDATCGKEAVVERRETQ